LLEEATFCFTLVFEDAANLCCTSAVFDTALEGLSFKLPSQDALLVNFGILNLEVEEIGDFSSATSTEPVLQVIWFRSFCASHDGLRLGIRKPDSIDVNDGGFVGGLELLLKEVEDICLISTVLLLDAVHPAFDDKRLSQILPRELFSPAVNLSFEGTSELSGFSGTAPVKDLFSTEVLSRISTSVSMLSLSLQVLLTLPLVDP